MSRRGPLAHGLRVAAVHARVSAQEELQYRSNAWINAASTLAELAVSLVALWLVFHGVSQIGGWSIDDLFVLLGSYFCLSAVVNGIVHPSVSEVVAQVRLGTFDFRLLKPVDSQLIALVQKISPWRITDLVLGVSLIAVGLLRHPAGLSVARLAEGVGMFLVASVIICGFWMLVTSIVFWTIQATEVLYALDDTYESLRWPIAIFPPGLRIALSTVFPAGFAVTVPAQALTGRLSWILAVTGVGLAAVFVALARTMWMRGIRRYEGASS